MSRSPRRVLSPSDLAGKPRPGAVWVGGRVAAVRGDHVDLADAFVTVRVQLVAGAERPAVGDLVVVRGAPEGVGLGAARIVERAPGLSGGFAQQRFRAEGVGAHLVARAEALRAIRTYFTAERFLEVETPVRVPSPGLDAYVDAFRAEGGFLITSPELHMKRLLVGGLPRVFQIARVSRHGELGALHEPEFTMVEWYRAFADMEATLADTEALVRRVAKAITGAPRIRRGRRSVDLGGPFQRLTVRDAFRRHAGIADAVDLAAADEDRYFQVYVDQVEPALARARRPVFLVEFPASQGGLARSLERDPSVVERYELFIFGVELSNGYGELTDPAEQRARFVRERARRRRARGRQQPIDERFMGALEEGLPPCSGNALGLDRLVALALGLEAISPVIAFPEGTK